MKKTSTGIILAIVILLFFAYSGYQLYLNRVGNIYTQYALLSTERETVETDCFVVRDEVRGEKSSSNKALIKNSGDGVYIPYVADGSRVAAGDTIALFFKSDSDARIYLQKQELEQELEYYEQLQNQALLSYLDIDRLDVTINAEIDEITEKIEDNDFSDMPDNFRNLIYNISSRQIATGEKVDFSRQIKELKKEIKELSGSGINYKKITAEYPGCFISSVDGYESTVDYDDVLGSSVGEAEKIITADPSRVKENVIGKIVGEYNWYAVCNLPSTAIENLYVGKEVTVSFDNTEVIDIVMKVRSISEVDDSRVAVVLQSSLMNENIAKLRKEKISIVLKELEGIKVPREAVVEVTETDSDGKETKALGVYILYGQIVRFRSIEPVLYEDEYVIVRNGSASGGEISLNDIIITKGRELCDGKILY